jgi:two-component system, cell cycle sensor histidine kinase and response regulator CckA
MDTAVTTFSVALGVAAVLGGVLMLRRRSMRHAVGGGDDNPLSPGAPDAPQSGGSATITGASGAPEAWPTIWLTSEGQFLEASKAARELFGDEVAEGGGTLIGRLRLAVIRAGEDLTAGDMVPGPALPAGEHSFGSWMRLMDDRVAVIFIPASAVAIASSGPGTLPRGDGAGALSSTSILLEAPFGVALLDRTLRIRDCTPYFANLLQEPGEPGAPVRVPIGRAFVDYVAEAQRDRFTGAFHDPISAELAVDGNGLEVAIGDDGERHVALHAAQIEDGYALYALDISQRHMLESRVLQSQKMQAVGQLAGGVAHDFNNLLTAMTGFCDLLLQRHRPGDQSFGDVMQIKQNANRAANLVRQLLAFSRQQTLIPKVVDLSDALADLSHLLRRLIGETVTLEVIHGRDLKPVKVDGGQLEQVLINLVVNARDAMPNGGTISMHTANTTTIKPLRRGEEVMPPGDYVMIEVIDTGVGIPLEHLTRILEPFFTTKEVWRGTGLGLSTAYGIIKQFGGYLFIDSTPNVGTTFAIYLPAWEGPINPVEEGVELRPNSDLTGTGTILLVEDEDPVRLFAARALRSKGYEVLEARSGESALDMLDDPELPGIDLLITDVVMPGIDGPTLVRRVRSSRPDLPVICISGYSEDALRQRVVGTQGISFLPKPFSLKQLASVVKTTITKPRSAS